MALFQLKQANRKQFHILAFLSSTSVVSCFILFFSIFSRSSRFFSGSYGDWQEMSVLMLLITTLAVILTLVFAYPAYYFYTNRKREAIICLTEIILLLFASVVSFMWFSL